VADMKEIKGARGVTDTDHDHDFSVQLRSSQWRNYGPTLLSTLGFLL
jgi:hypothetical protein